MTCVEVREALSARLDGEPPGVTDSVLRDHLAVCAPCTRYDEQLHGLADVLGRSVSSSPPPVRVWPAARRTGVLRWSIAATATVELVCSALLFLHEHGYTGEDHASHESLSFTLALCAGLFWVALRPAYARGYLPLLGVAATLLTATAVLDVASGRAEPTEEMPHLSLVVATVLLWLLTHNRRPRRHRRVTARTPRIVRAAPRALHAVRRSTAVRRRATCLAALVAASVLLAAPAHAHATLQQSDPASGSTVAALPGKVVLRFDESVTLLPTSLQVYGPDGARVDDGHVTHVSGDDARVAVGVAGSARGTYLVSWRVVSADSHPVSGAFTFSVERASAAPAAHAVQPDRTVSVLLGAARWLGYLGITVLLGAVVFLRRCWPAGWDTPAARRAVLTGAGALAIGAVFGVLLKGPYDAALGLGDAGRSSLLSEVLSTTYGKALVVRLVLVALAVVLLVTSARRTSVLRATAEVLLALALLATFAAAGHAVASHPVALAVPVDMAHVAATAVWIGGLILLVASVLRRAPDAAQIAARFSRLAFGAVVILVLTGTYQSWRQVGAWAAFTDTTYGRELLVKLGLVALILVVAAVSRALVRRRSTATVPALRRTVALEVVGGLLVLAVTSALVATEPARTAYHPSVATSLALGPDTVQVSAVPRGTGRMSLHLYLFDRTGQPTEPAQVSAALSLPGKDIGPLPVQLVRAGLGHRIGLVVVPVTGDWQLTVSVRTTQIDEYGKTVTLPIR